jgi:hypothetical protein
VTLSQRPLQDLDGLTLLSRADVAVDLHRVLVDAWRSSSWAMRGWTPAPTSRLAAPWRIVKSHLREAGSVE